MYQSLCILWQRLGEESPLQLSSLPAASRFAPDDEWSHHVRNPTPRNTLPASAFCSKSQVSSPVPPLCHAYFNYLTGLQRQGRELVLNRCHFSSPPGGYEGGCKWLEVISWNEPGESNAHTAILPLQRYLKPRDSKSILASSVLPLCCKESS